MRSKRYGNKALRAWWSIHVEAWRKSGLSRRKYCREHRLCEETFTRWLNVLLGAEKLRADRELAREQKAKKRRPNLSTDKRNRAAQAFWAMHVEAQRWSGMTMRDYCDAHRISSHSMARWRDLIDASEAPSDWRSQLHPSARAPISTSASTGAKDEQPNERLTNGHAADLARVERFARRTFSDEEKRAMVLETEQPGRHRLVRGPTPRHRSEHALPMAGAARARQGEARAACRCQHDREGREERFSRGGSVRPAHGACRDDARRPAGRPQGLCARSRNPIQHLAHAFSDDMQRAAAAAADRALNVEADLFARQMVGQRLATRGPFGLLLLAMRTLLFFAGKIAVDLFERERQLVGIKALGTAAKLRPLQLLDDRLQALDLAVAVLDGGGHIANEMLQMSRFGRQIVEIEPHARIYPIRLIRRSDFARFYADFCSFLACQSRPPYTFGRSPVDAFNQHGELCWRERHRTAGIAHPRPDETT